MRPRDVRSAPARGRRGRSPRALGSGNLPRAAGPQLRASGLARVGLAVRPRRESGQLSPVPKGHGARRRRGRPGSRPGRSLSRPADVRAAPRPRPRPGRLTAGSCRDCAGCSARAACARTAWLGLRARPDPGARRTGRGASRPPGHLPAALLTAGAARPALYGRLGGRGLTRTRPAAARPPHLVTRTGAPSRERARLQGGDCERAARRDLARRAPSSPLEGGAQVTVPAGAGVSSSPRASPWVGRAVSLRPPTLTRCRLNLLSLTALSEIVCFVLIYT